MVSIDLLTEGSEDVELPTGAPAVVSSLIAAKGLQEDDGADSNGESKKTQ